MSWWGKNVAGKAGKWVGTLLGGPFGLGLGWLHDEQKKAMERQAALAENQAFVQQSALADQMAKVQEEEDKAKAAAAATLNAMKGGTSALLYNNNYLGVGSNKKGTLG